VSVIKPPRVESRKLFGHKSSGAHCVPGSPNGLGIGYMLGKEMHRSPRGAALIAHAVQHKPEIGNRHTKKIEVFLADTAASDMKEPSLWWALEDSPDDENVPME
jgi:hypothetical protein